MSTEKEEKNDDEDVSDEEEELEEGVEQFIYKIIPWPPLGPPPLPPPLCFIDVYDEEMRKYVSIYLMNQDIWLLNGITV